MSFPDIPPGKKLPLVDDTTNRLPDPTMEAIASAPELSATIVTTMAPRDTLNILDFGVVTGTASSQTAAIQAALDANPGRSFYFPPGDYRLDTTLVVSANNSLVIEADARLYAGAAMGDMVRYDNGQSSVANYAQDKGVWGRGMLDGNLLADKCLTVSSVIRFTIEGLTIKDPLRRGVYLRPLGAEVIMRNVRMHNTGTTNSHKTMTVSTTNASTTVTRTAGDTFTAADVNAPIYGAGIPAGAYISAYTNANTATMSIAATATATGVDAGVVTNIALECEMGDSHFADVVMRDFTIGVWNRAGANVFNEVHPWLGTLAQLTVRYQYSAGFKVSNTCTIDKPYVDTYRYGFQGDGTTLGVQITNPRFYCNSSNLSAGLATTYPGAIYACGTAGQRFDVIGGQYSGHTSFSFPFFEGNKRRFFNRGGNILSAVTAFGDYSWGIKLGPNSFTPTLEGSTGTSGNSYTAQEGYFTVHEGLYGVGFVEFVFRVAGTIGAGTTGNLRVGGMPYPEGATGIRPGNGNINRLTNLDATGLETSANTPAGPPWNASNQFAAVTKIASGATTSVAVPASGTAVEIWGRVIIPYIHSTA